MTRRARTRFLLAPKRATALGLTKFPTSNGPGPDLVIAALESAGASNNGAWLALANNLPSPVSVTSASPASATGTSGALTFTFSDSAGYHRGRCADQQRP